MSKKEKKTNAMRQLDVAGIAYQVLTYTCDGVNFDGKQVADQVGLPHSQVYKTLVTTDTKAGVFVCCIPVDKQLDLKALAAAAGCKRLEMVEVKGIQALTGYIRGGVSPVGMKKQYPTFLHREALDHARIAVSAGIRGMQLLVSPQALVSHLEAATGSFGVDAD